MTREEFDNLKRGDIVQNLGSRNSYVVHGAHSNAYIAIAMVEITNPHEWELVKVKPS